MNRPRNSGALIVVAVLMASIAVPLMLPTSPFVPPAAGYAQINYRKRINACRKRCGIQTTVLGACRHRAARGAKKTCRAAYKLQQAACTDRSCRRLAKGALKSCVVEQVATLRGDTQVVRNAGARQRCGRCCRTGKGTFGCRSYFGISRFYGSYSGRMYGPGYQRPRHIFCVDRSTTSDLADQVRQRASRLAPALTVGW